MINDWFGGILASSIIFIVSLSLGLSRQERREKAIKRAIAAALNWSDSLSPLDFERYCCEFLCLIGWNAETTKASGDQGADIIASRDGIRIVCQCKRYAKAVGNKAVQEAYAAKQFYNAAAGAVISNSSFTRGAVELATATDIKLFHFTELVRFNSTMIPGMADIDPAGLSPGEIQAEEKFRIIQKATYTITLISIAVMFLCILGAAFALDGVAQSR